MLKLKNILYKIFSIMLLSLIAILIMSYVNSTGLIQGADIYGHLYKTDLLFNNIKNGNFFTLYDSQWYNGIQMFRYWPPLSYYILAGIQQLCSGNIESAYILFIGISYIISGYAWLLFGVSENKKTLGLFCAIFYWFLPDNLRILFCEGNLPRIMFIVLLPYLLFFIWKFIYHKKNIYIIPIIITSIICIFTHLMMSAIIAIGLTVFLFIYFLNTKDFKRSFSSVIAIALGYISGGIILLPGLMGGIVSQSSSASISTLKDWSQELSKSLNPFLRFNEPTIYYFGLAILIILILGLRIAIVKNNKLLIAPLLTSLIFMLLTSSSLSDYIALLPLSQVWWMERFTVISSTLFIFSFFLYKEIKYRKLFFILCFLLLFVDIIPSTKLFGEITGRNIYETEKYYDDIYLFNEAEKNTSNRLSIVDESLIGSYESFFIKNKAINITTGWALQGAQTYQNIVYLNEAIAVESYSYLFDRLINLGSDTVIIKKSLLDISQLNNLKQMAEKYNYTIIKENDYCVLFKLKDINYTFGVVNEYENIAIGSSSRYISLIYPSFENGTSPYIDDYTIKDLSKYKKIYLSGEFFKDKNKAELLVQELSNLDIQIYIDISKLKQNFQGFQSFLDVQARVLTLTESFPNITYKGKEYQINHNMSENWNASYITNEAASDEHFIYTSQNYSYLRQNGNITYIGMNLIYFYNQFPTDNLKFILDGIFETTEKDEIINKTIVPIKIDINQNTSTITINSNYDNVNTTLSYQDFFNSNQETFNNDNLLTVNKGNTEIKFSYKYFTEGLIISSIGLLLSLIFTIYILINFKKGDSHENAINSNTVL